MIAAVEVTLGRSELLGIRGTKDLAQSLLVKYCRRLAYTCRKKS